MDIKYWLTASLAIILIAFSKAGFGGGPGVLATPIMTIITSPRNAIAIMLPIMIVCDLWCVATYRKGCVWNLVLRLLVGFLIGVGVATFLLAKVPGQELWLKKTIGALSVFFGLTYFLVLKDEKKLAAIIPQGLWFGLIMGVIAGISSTLAHAAGPPVAMYLMSQTRGQSKENFMGTIVVYSLFGNLLKIPSYWISGAMTIQTLYLTWPLIAVVPLGLASGRWLNKKMAGANFQTSINGILIIIGLYLILA